MLHDEIHPVRGGGWAGRGNGGSVRHCSCLGTLGTKGAIIGGAFLWYQVGRPAEGFSPHRTNNQGGRPPYLKAAIVPGQGGRLCRGPTLALALWRRLSFGKDGHQAEGFSPHRTNN